jgi:hypothetical protein
MNLAEQMRKTADEAKEKVDISKYIEKIKTAAFYGERSVRINYISALEKARLEKEGFKVENTYDQREGDSWATISW